MLTDDMDMARRCAPPPPPIDLTRPHTVLLMSTVIGGTAFRGAYTGELAYQLRNADGKTSIAEMHDKAVQRMNGGREWQVPEYRSSLTRGSLVFPKPTCTSKTPEQMYTDSESGKMHAPEPQTVQLLSQP